MVAATNSSGLTPDQTVSRNLQELRDAGLVEFLDRGFYFLLDAVVDVDDEDLTDEALDHAIRASRLILREIETGSSEVLARRRRGQDRLRALTLDQYGRSCAVCDIDDPTLLIASHILPWADAPDHRGKLDNVVGLCRLHDVLFERGYWSLTDNLELVKREHVSGRPIRLLLDHLDSFRPPNHFPPGVAFVTAHRRRFGFG